MHEIIEVLMRGGTQSDRREERGEGMRLGTLSTLNLVELIEGEREGGIQSGSELSGPIPFSLLPKHSFITYKSSSLLFGTLITSPTSRSSHNAPTELNYLPFLLYYSLTLV